MTVHIAEVIFAGVFFLALVVWVVARSIKTAEDPAKMIFKWCITIPLVLLCLLSVRLFGLLAPAVIVVCAIVLSVLWTPHLGELFASPLTGLFDGGNVAPEPRPLYSVAQSRQKQGRYQEAMAEIHKQLAIFPNDFEGQMLLAQVQAENLNDLPAAQATIDGLASQEGHADKNIVFALFSMADWQLKYAHDAEAAGRALKKVVELFPGSEFALSAGQRLGHLDYEKTLAAREKKFTVVEDKRRLGLMMSADHLKNAETDPTELAAQYVQHLTQHPFDTDAREKLAVIYADHYQRLDLASDQLEQMIAQPNQPARLVVRWLNLLADLEIRCGADYETARKTVQRIVDLEPEAAAAGLARNRLALLRLELKAQGKKADVKMGTYEQNLGLKGPKELVQ